MYGVNKLPVFSTYAKAVGILCSLIHRHWSDMILAFLLVDAVGDSSPVSDYSALRGGDGFFILN